MAAFRLVAVYHKRAFWRVGHFCIQVSLKKPLSPFLGNSTYDLGRRFGILTISNSSFIQYWYLNQFSANLAGQQGVGLWYPKRGVGSRGLWVGLFPAFLFRRPCLRWRPYLCTSSGRSSVLQLCTGGWYSEDGNLTCCLALPLHQAPLGHPTWGIKPLMTGEHKGRGWGSRELWEERKPGCGAACVPSNFPWEKFDYIFGKYLWFPENF